MSQPEPYPGGWGFIEQHGQLLESYSSASRNFGRNTPSMTKVATEPDVEHNEHVHISPDNSRGDDQTRASSGLQNTRSLLGLSPIAPIDEEHDRAESASLWWSQVRLALREPIAEFFGVFIMVLFGDGSVAQVLLSAGERSAPGGNGFGAYQSMWVTAASRTSTSRLTVITDHGDGASG